MKVYIIHENNDWLPPLRSALERASVPYEEWYLDGGHFDMHEPPPEGVFLNRMSASSHTRGHAVSVDFTREVLAWLEYHGRRVVNGPNAFALEISKVKQQLALEALDVRTPATRAVAGTSDDLIEAASDVPLPFVTKHNRGGKGLGVQLFRSREAFAEYVHSDEFAPPPGNVTLLQQYIEAREPFITRAEFVGGEFVYAIRVDTSEGFELCPADACRVERDATCSTGVGEEDSLFSLREDVDPGLIDTYRQFLEKNQIDIAGIEFIEDVDGNTWTYDVNGTTNYAPDIEAKVEKGGMDKVAGFLGSLLQKELATA